MQESTYSSLSEPYFQRLAKGLPNNESIEQLDIESYKLFLESLGLQLKAILNDEANWQDEIANVANEIAETQAVLEEKTQEREQLEDEVATQRGIAQLAKQKFENPTELNLEYSSVSVSLKKSVAQLKESYSVLEEEHAQLEEDLEGFLEDFDRRHHLVSEMADAISRFRDRFEDRGLDTPRETEGRTPFEEERSEDEHIEPKGEHEEEHEDADLMV